MSPLPSSLISRICCDLVMYIKIVNKLVNHPFENFFPIEPNIHHTCTSSHHIQLKPIDLPVCSACYNFFSARVVRVWNTLPIHIVLAFSLSSFKSILLCLIYVL